MIKFIELKKVYGKQTVLNIENLEIPKGQTLGIVGNNGAGKTTMMSVLLDLISATSGEAISKGRNVNLSADWKNYTSSFLDESFLIGYLSPDEYFEFIASLRGVNKIDLKKHLDLFEDFFNGEIVGANKYLRDLSKGNQKKTGIVASLIGNPEVVVLDEPFANLDPSTQFRLKNILKKISSETDTTFLISSHDLNHVSEVCDRIIVLEKGIIIKDLERSENWLKQLEEIFKIEAEG